MNIYSLYVTRSKDEREYLYRVLEFIQRNKYSAQIVHMDFKWNAEVSNIRFNKQSIPVKKYNYIHGYPTIKTYTITCLDDLIKLYIHIPGKSLFMYSGHSDGMYLVKHNIRLLRIEDFCYFAKSIIHTKADVFVFDCCLCGNINCLSVCRGYTDYIIASTSYWSFLSILETHGIYEPANNMVDYCKKMIRQLIRIEKKNKRYFHHRLFTVFDESIFR